MPFVVTGKNLDVYESYKKIPADYFSGNSNFMVEEYAGGIRAEVNGFIIQVVNDTGERVNLKIQSDCWTTDYFGRRPSADLWFLLAPDQIDMGWIIYNCNFNLRTIVEENEVPHERNWKPLSQADNAGLYTLAVSLLKNAPIRAEGAPSFLRRAIDLFHCVSG